MCISGHAIPIALYSMFYIVSRLMRIFKDDYCVRESTLANTAAAQYLEIGADGVHSCSCCVED